MQRLVSWIVMVPVALAVAVFSVTNRDTVFLDTWPLDSAIGVPVFALVLASIALGVLIGGTAAWLVAGKARRLARRKAHEADMANREIARLQSRIEILQAADSDSQRLPPPPIPPGI